MIFKWIVSSFDLKIVIDDFLSLMLEILTKTGYVDLLNDITSCLNSQAPELSRGPRARSARSGENGEGEVRSL